MLPNHHQKLGRAQVNCRSIASFLHGIQRLLEEPRRFDTETLRTRQECFQPEITASDFTRLDFDLWDWFSVNHHRHRQLSERRAFDGHGLDGAFDRSGIPVLKHSLADLDTIAAQKLIASLLQRERFVFFDLLEVGWSDALLMVLKEQLISLLNPLANVLHSLRADLLPELDSVPAFGNMSLKPCTV